VRPHTVKSIAAIGRLLIVGTLAAVTGALWAAAPAYAHAVLVSSDPPEGGSVSPDLAQVTLTFNDPVQAEFAQVTVIDATGAQRQQGAAEVDGAQVTQQVAGLMAGGHTISYRIVSSDGDPVTGEIAFTVAAPVEAAPVAPSAEPTPEPTQSSQTAEVPVAPASDAATPEASSAEDSGTSPWAVAGIGAAAVAAASAAAVAVGRRGRQMSETGPGDPDRPEEQ